MNIKWSPKAIDGLNLDPTRRNQLDILMTLERDEAEVVTDDRDLIGIIRSFGEG